MPHSCSIHLLPSLPAFSAAVLASFALSYAQTTVVERPQMSDVLRSFTCCKESMYYVYFAAETKRAQEDVQRAQEVSPRRSNARRTASTPCTACIVSRARSCTLSTSRKAADCFYITPFLWVFGLSVVGGREDLDLDPVFHDLPALRSSVKKNFWRTLTLISLHW